MSWKPCCCTEAGFTCNPCTVKGPPQWVTTVVAGFQKWDYSSCTNCTNINGTYVQPWTKDQLNTCWTFQVFPGRGCGTGCSGTGSAGVTHRIESKLVGSLYQLRVWTKLSDGVGTGPEYYTPVLLQQASPNFDCYAILNNQTITSYYYQLSMACCSYPPTNNPFTRYSPPTIQLTFTG